MAKLKKLGKVGVYLTHNKAKSFFSGIRKDVQQVPMAVKILILNMSLLRFGRGIGVNMYYSIFLKTIFENIIIVALLGSLLAFTKLLFSIPAGVLNSKINSQKILIFGKILYILVGLTYFVAGYFNIPALVILAILLSGIASPMVFNTNQFLIRRLVPIKLSSRTFGLFFSTYQFGYLVAALLTALLMKFNLPIMYFFLIASGITAITLISNTKDSIVDKHGLFYEIKKETTPKVYKQVFSHIKEHTNGLGIMLFLQSLHGIMYYLGFMFIPILAIAKDFNLVQIALLFAIMRIPHALTVYLEALFSERRELKVTLLSFVIIAILMGVIAVSKNFYMILGVSLLMSFFIATTRPMLSGMITRLIKTDEQAEITGVQDFVNRGGEIIGYLIFGLLAQYIGLEFAFIGVAIGAIILTTYAYKKRKRIKFLE